MPAVDVLIPTRDTRELTMRCLRALAEPSPGLELRCIVVDNGSSDGTGAAIAAGFPGVEVIRNEANEGYGAACNRAAAAGDGELLLILNNDVFARPGAVERLVAGLAAAPGHAAAGGRLVDVGTDDPQVGFAIRAFPTLAQQLAILVGLERHWPGNPISRRHLMLDFDYGRSQDAEQVAGACLLCRRADFEALGGFDEGFYYWYEDVDLVLRLRARGPIAYVADAVFEHVGGASFAGWQRPEAIVVASRSAIRYFAKHHPRREQLVLRGAIAALAAVRALGWRFLDRDRSAAYAQVIRLALG